MLLKFKYQALHIIKIVCVGTFLTFFGCKKDSEPEDVATVFEISKAR
jgi:hypothetical protein